MNEPTFLSTFTGVGGLDLGIELSNFHRIACIEQDPSARKTFLANRPTASFLEPHDITKLATTLKPPDIGLSPRKLGLLAGAPPCQPFSKAGQWAPNGYLGLTDPRSSTISAFLILVERFLPKVFLLENVPGFTIGPNSTISLIKERLEEINRNYNTAYQLESRIVNAAHFGVPQRRKRALLLAIREGNSFNWPIPTYCDQPVRAYDALRNVTVHNPPVAKGKWADLLPSIPEGKNYLWHTPNGGGRPIFGYRTRFWSFLLKLSKSEPSWTLSAHPGPATGPFHWDNRPLAVEELLRLQTFPASWKVEGSFQTQVKQVGNATPPLLAEIVSRAIGEQIFGLSYDHQPSLLIERADTIPEKEQVASVPQKYKGLEGPHPPHPGPGRGPRPRSVDSKDNGIDTSTIPDVMISRISLATSSR